MVGGFLYAPIVVVVVAGNDVVGQFHCRAARLVELVDVMGLSHRKLVTVLFCELRQLLVEQKHDVHPDAEIGRMEEALLFGQTASLDFLEMVLPGCSANHNGQM